MGEGFISRGNTQKPMTYTNPNLLDNWDFRNPVNQRGSIAIDDINYVIDRWKFTPNIELTSDGIEFSTNSTQTDVVQIFQIIEPKTKAEITGKTVTITLDTNHGVICASAVYEDGYIVLDDHFACIIYGGDVYIRPLTDGNTIYRVKLELGTVSTLANDPPMDYALELAKCQCYTQKFDAVDLQAITLLESGSTSTFFPIYFKTKRITPTVTFPAHSNFRILVKHGANQTSAVSITSMETYIVTKYMAVLRVNHDAQSINATAILQRSDARVEEPYILVSADL